MHVEEADRSRMAQGVQTRQQEWCNRDGFRSNQLPKVTNLRQGPTQRARNVAARTQLRLKKGCCNMSISLGGCRDEGYSEVLGKSQNYSSGCIWIWCAYVCTCVCIYFVYMRTYVRTHQWDVRTYVRAYVYTLCICVRTTYAPMRLFANTWGSIGFASIVNYKV